ncbi:hypothetical protein sscle_01g006800 [Sclerotinia sclerotiorum 1980 UF-70]|uniref:Uncharacterized protein n=1 Tax=Sclerotinia sclerotiorum (strain ATCC 18683 / 1980 / Ss-1) TaxID=665079 RepID=A0A1D9PTB1_SCLS1|nr:hypothetical protein sscle_01g006800 [Sclerotinia sclerotiorum 1980 UF-70]
MISKRPSQSGVKQTIWGARTCPLILPSGGWSQYERYDLDTAAKWRNIPVFNLNRRHGKQFHNEATHGNSFHETVLDDGSEEMGGSIMFWSRRPWKELHRLTPDIQIWMVEPSPEWGTSPSQSQS